MTKITDIAAKLLKKLYTLHRNDTLNLSDARFQFIYTPNVGFNLLNHDITNEYTLLIQDISSVKNLFNAFQFLEQEGLVLFKTGMEGMLIYKISLTSHGIKTIEGIDEPEYKKVFENHFHLKIAENVNFESLDLLHNTK